MLKEINKDTAIAEFHNGKEVLLYHTKLKRMFTSTELMECCRFLIDGEVIVSDESKQSDSQLKDEIQNDTATQDNNIKEDVKPYIDETITKEVMLEENKTNDTESNGIKHTSNNDVKTEVIDSGSDDQIDYNDLIPGKKGRKITIDLGKLYSLRRAKWSIKDIAYELNCSVATVNKYVSNKELEQRVLEMQSSR